MKTKMFLSMRRLGLPAVAGLLALVGASAGSSGIVHAGPPVLSFIVNSTADKPDAVPGDGKCEAAGVKKKCTLRAAVMEANANPDANSIELGAHVYKLKRVGTDDTALYGDLDITSKVGIFGQSQNGTIIDGQKIDRLFDVRTGGELELDRMTLTNGATGDSGGGVNVSSGQATLAFVVVKNNSAAAGGGIAVSASGGIGILGSRIESNAAFIGDLRTVVPVRLAVTLAVTSTRQLPSMTAMTLNLALPN